MKPCTVVSLLAYELNESKPQLKPGIFVIPPAEKGDIQVLSIENSARPFYVDYDRGIIQIPYDPEIVARSVVMDHIRATIHVTEGCHPGLFYVEGIKDKKTVQALHKVEIDKASKAQNAWYARLVKAGDDVWQKFRRHNTISDSHRMACKQLGLKREWAEELKAEDTKECQFCTSLISSRAIVCPICRFPQADALAKMPKEVQEVMMKAISARA